MSGAADRHQPGSEDGRRRTAVVALFRGVNVGGARRLRMADLRAVLHDLGYVDATTYLQSGNAVLSVTVAQLPVLAGRIEQGLREVHGLETTVILRTGEELERTVAGNPYAGAEPDPRFVHTLFLADEPGAERIAELEPDAALPDRFVLQGREVFVHYPAGSGRSPLTLGWFERRLGVAGTARNHRTVTRLLTMADERAQALTD